jgi:hypothetical protein
MLKPSLAKRSSHEETTNESAPVRTGLGALGALGVGESAPKLKTLPPSVVKDIEQKNVARKLASLSPIVIKIRRCIACGSPFESAGNRTCGCTSRTAGSIAGREII